MISMLQLFFYHYPSHQLRISSEEEYKQIIDGQTIECLMYISKNLPTFPFLRYLFSKEEQTETTFKAPHN